MSAEFWLEIAKLVVTTAATGVAALFGIRIASSQRDIARQQKNIASESRQISSAKLNLDLFDQRYAIFMEVWAFLSAGPNVTSESHPMSDFTNSIPKAQFLFGTEIADYMREMDRKRSALVLLYKQVMYPPPDYAVRVSELNTWFLEEASGCYKRFAPYLDFSIWQSQHWARVRVGIDSPADPS